MTEKPICCYLFEAYSIQRWIFAGGRLRDAVGASRLLDNLCSWDEKDVLAGALVAAKLETSPDIARRAGGGLCVYHPNEAALARLRAIFALKVRAAAPDLPFVDAIGEGEGKAAAFDAARSALNAARAVPQLDPLRAGPFVLPTPRTGAPAAYREALERGGEILDAGLRAKRAAVRETRSAIEGKFDPAGHAKFPVELSEDGPRGNPVFPFHGDNRYVGLLHADGNGMGAIMQDLGRRLGQAGGPDYAEGFRVFSSVLAQATVEAVQIALEKLEPSAGGIWPIRPLILGGDDLAAILRGDDAIPLTAAFLEAFEEKTKDAFDGLRKGEAGAFWRDVLPRYLSAGAGIVFVKSNQPFAQAYELAASLAKAAKDQAKDWVDNGAVPPATIAFHRISTADIAAEWDDVLTGQLVSGSTQLTMNPYVVSTKSAAGAPTSAPRIEQLEHLCRTLDDRDVARGPARTLTPAFLTAGWRRDWERMLSMAKERNPASTARFVEALEALGCVDGPLSQDGRTPVLDALNWIAVARKRNEGRVSAKEERHADA